MTVENPQTYLHDLQNGIHPSEISIGWLDTIITRADGAHVSVGNYTEEKSNEKFHRLFLFAPKNMFSEHLIMAVTVGDTSNIKQRDPVIILGIPEELSENNFFSHWRYKGYGKKPWEATTTFGKCILDSLEADKKRKQSMIRSGHFVSRDILSHNIDVRATTDRFLTTLSGWVEEPKTFERALLQPSIVTK